MIILILVLVVDHAIFYTYYIIIWQTLTDNVFDMHIQLLYMLRNNSIKYCNTFTFCATQDSVTLLITMLQA